VRKALRAMSEPVIVLDQHESAHASLDLSIGAAIYGILRAGSIDIALEAVTGVYLRPYDVRQLPALESLGPGASIWRHTVELDDALQAWAEVTPALVVNRPSAMASNGSKPYQSALIRAAGFDVPDTLVTTDPSAVLSFWKKHGTVIYKSISGIRSIVTRLRPEHREKLPDVSHCPTQFQEYIEGTDIRIHVVGDEVFGCEIRSDADDYRYPPGESADPQVRNWHVPDELAERCRRLAAALELAVAGIDLRCTAAGRFYCFEANPSPAFSFYQEATGQPLGEAIARLLSNAARTQF
jgi:glutathione synthase/RimK-type ligase-like ATP-grasp enzyme